MPAMARIAANGSVERSALLLTLPDAISGLTANSSAVATQIAEKRGTRSAKRRSSRASSVAFSPFSWSDGGPTASVRGPATIRDQNSLLLAVDGVVETLRNSGLFWKAALNVVPVRRPLRRLGKAWESNRRPTWRRSRLLHAAGC